MTAREFRAGVVICLAALCLIALLGVIWIGSNVSNIRTSACVLAAWRSDATYQFRRSTFLRKNNDVCTRLVRVRGAK